MSKYSSGSWKFFVRIHRQNVRNSTFPQSHKRLYSYYILSDSRSSHIIYNIVSRWTIYGIIYNNETRHAHKLEEKKINKEIFSRRVCDILRAEMPSPTSPAGKRRQRAEKFCRWFYSRSLLLVFPLINTNDTLIQSAFHYLTLQKVYAVAGAAEKSYTFAIRHSSFSVHYKLALCEKSYKRFFLFVTKYMLVYTVF